MQVRPLADRVIIKRSKKNDRSAGGIIIPETAADHEQAWHGEVIAVGPGKVTDTGLHLEPRVKTGDKVIVGKYTGSNIEADGEEFVVAREDDILGVIDG